MVDNRLRPLSFSLTVGMETLQHAYTQLSDAAQRNTETHTLLNTAHTLLHHYQVNTRTCGRVNTHTCTGKNMHTLLEQFGVNENRWGNPVSPVGFNKVISCHYVMSALSVPGWLGLFRELQWEEMKHHIEETFLWCLTVFIKHLEIMKWKVCYSLRNSSHSDKKVFRSKWKASTLLHTSCFCCWETWYNWSVDN